MISRKLRLPPRGFRGPHHKITHLPFFNVKSSPNHLSHNRFGLIIGNQIEPKSTRRHFWRRRFFDILKFWPPLGLDILIVATRTLPKLKKAELEKELSQALQKIKSHYA